MVDWAGLENRCAGNGTGGSNPPLSAKSGQGWIPGEGGSGLEEDVPRVEGCKTLMVPRDDGLASHLGGSAGFSGPAMPSASP